MFHVKHFRHPFVVKDCTVDFCRSADSPATNELKEAGCSAYTLKPPRPIALASIPKRINSIRRPGRRLTEWHRGRFADRLKFEIHTVCFSRPQI